MNLGKKSCVFIKSSTQKKGRRLSEIVIMENLWEETKVQKLLLRLIVLDMTIEFFLECYLNLMSVGGPNYICESYRERGRKGEVWFRCLGKDLHFNFAVTSSSTVKWDEQN